jgi:DNA-binding transcriptional MerR regulator
MTVDQVLSDAGQKISTLGIEQDPQSRVATLPDIRSFRMYRNQNLVSPPNTKEGTAGTYGRKHVLQLVAIKSLQSQRLPLREIRIRLANAGENELEKLIDAPAGSRSFSAKPKRSDLGPPKKDRRWIHFQPADGVMVMVADDALASARPSSVRAIGEMVVTSLLSLRT